MTLHALDIESLRNLQSPTLSLHPQMNLIFGDNGSGKTSILEAIYLLAFGRSFRTQKIKHIIQHEQPCFRVVANCVISQLYQEDSQVIGIERGLSGPYRIKIAGQRAKSIAEVAAVLPVQLLNLDHYQLLSASPSVRRKQMDWGVFHVEHGFLNTWKQFMRGLQQRNALLKSKASEPSECAFWEEMIVENSETLHIMRQRFCHHWFQEVAPYLEAFIGSQSEISFDYYPGWQRNTSFSEIMMRTAARDRVLGYTQFGAHKADFKLLIDGNPAEHILSTGQQKCVVCLLQLAQSAYVARLTGKKPIYLIDDLPAELDNHAKAFLFETLHKIKGQVFLTSVEPTAFEHITSAYDAKKFHVEQGEVKEVV